MYAAQRSANIFFRAEGCILAAIKYPPKTSAESKQSDSNITFDKVSKSLRQIVAKNPDVYSQPRQCEALLRDFCPGHNREIFILMAALKSRIVTDLLSYRGSVLGNVQKDNLVDRLQSECGFGTKDAQWAVNSWDMALRKVGPNTPDQQGSNYQTTEGIEDSSLSKDEPSTHDSSSSFLPNTIPSNNERESGKEDSDHTGHSYSTQSTKTHSSRKRILIFVPLAIVVAVIGFGVVGGLLNPSNDNDNGREGQTPPPTTTPPTVMSETDPQFPAERTTDDITTGGELNRTVGNTADSDGSASAANNDNWSIVLE